MAKRAVTIVYASLGMWALRKTGEPEQFIRIGFVSGKTLKSAERKLKSEAIEPVVSAFVLEEKNSVYNARMLHDFRVFLVGSVKLMPVTPLKEVLRKLKAGIPLEKTGDKYV
jgi:hypothetical protein